MSDIRRRWGAVLAALVLGLTMALPQALSAAALSAGEQAVQAKAAASVAQLGTATGPIRCGLAQGGCLQDFQYGTIYWTSGTGAHFVKGAIRSKWASMGWENSVLGYPRSDEKCGLAQGGCLSDFQHGTIYWTSGTGAHFVKGAIRTYWASTGWENGRYGYPKTDELCRTGTGGTLCRQDFQGGTIKWRSGTGIIDCSRLRCVALTFDGGPSPYTGQLLDTLDARNVQVTFFVVGQYIDGNPAAVKRAHTNGNEVMNHSWSHPCLIDNCPSAPTQGPISSTEIRSQLDRTSDKIQATAGERPTMLRPPFGEYDQRLLDISRTEGLAVVNWSADTIDWRDQNTAIIRERAVTKATPGGIILMHDTMPTTIAAVPGIISDLQAKGYTLVPAGDVIGNPLPGVFYTHR